MGGQLSWTQVPLHSWLRAHPSPHQPQPMKRSARRQRSHVKKWRQPGPVTFTRHTWGHRIEVSRGHGGPGPTSCPGPPPLTLVAEAKSSESSRSLTACRSGAGSSSEKLAKATT